MFQPTLTSIPLLATVIRVVVVVGFAFGAVCNGMLAVEIEHSHADVHHEHGHDHPHHHGDGGTSGHGDDVPASERGDERERDPGEDSDAGTHCHTVLIEAGQMIAPMIDCVLPVTAPVLATRRTGTLRCPTGPSFNLLKPPQLV